MDPEFYLGTRVVQKTLDQAKSRVLGDENLLGVIRGILYRTVTSRKREKVVRRGGLLILTNKRLVFYIPELLGGFDQITVPYDQINTVSSHTGWVGDQLTIHASSQSVDVHSIPKGDAGHMVQLIRDKVAESKASVSVAAPPQIDIVAQLKN